MNKFNERRLEIKKFLLPMFNVGSLLMILWIIFFIIYNRFPYIRPGHEIIYETKKKHLQSNFQFPPSTQIRLVIFGNSKTLSGFIPDEFDFGNSTKIYSYNLGLPNYGYFIDELKLLVQNRQVPTHVFLTILWSSREINERKTPFLDDRVIINYIFPFRDLPRNLVLFFFRAMDYESVKSFYIYCRNSALNMQRDRGYYFISGQSHFKNNSLPDNFILQTDKPSIIATRRVLTKGPIFNELLLLSKKYNIHFYFVPTYYRINEYASPSNYCEDLLRILKPYAYFHVIGPRYFLFSNKHFSDPTHLNRNGAKIYTNKLKFLFKGAISE